MIWKITLLFIFSFNSNLFFIITLFVAIFLDFKKLWGLDFFFKTLPF